MTSVDDKMRVQHKKICEQLNIDSPTEERSWKSYLDIKHNYTLDGDPIHWLCCALYVACKLSVTPTVSNQESDLFIKGNCVSLTRLLRLCNITLHDFFTKIKRWIEMASVPADYRRQIEHLIQSFGVSMSVYAKYKIIFEDLFLKAIAEDGKKSKKAKPVPCTPQKLFEFGWTLFICAKAEYPARTNELVTSFHMLLACLDLLFANAIADTRRDLINPEFSGLPSNWDTMMDYREKPLCIISELCNKHETSKIDALETKMYAWKQVIRKFFDAKTLLGNGETFLDILSVVNFNDNLVSLNRIYDTYILSCGEFDERIALNSKISENMSKTKQSVISDSITSLTHATPLTGRERLHNSEFYSTPITEATKNVSKLRTKLAYYEGQPQENFIELLKGSPPELINNIVDRLQRAKKIYLEKFSNSNDRFVLSEALYYRLLENIIRNEVKQKGQSNGILIIKELCSQEKFNNVLLACGLIIVNYAYNSQLNFLIILNIFDLHAYDFYRIIELVVLYHNDHLTRDIIKYLNRIEEECLESICWEGASPIWEKLKELKEKPIPTSQEVDIPRVMGGDMSGITPHKLVNNGQFKYDTPVKNNTEAHVVASSSSSTSLVREAARKQLFKEDENTQERGNVDDPTPANQTVILPTESFNSPIKTSQNSGNVTRKTGAGSLCLFLRKFYKLAATRINDLCANLQITSSELLLQIWTIFEYSITKKRDLIKDRHLDQLIMCAIYVFVKIKNLNKSFTEIMKFYRQQPQSASHVYRSVFISNDSTPPTSPRSNNDAPQNPTVQPGDMAGNSTLHGRQIRGDIIWFYNNIYIRAMQDYVSKFSTSATRDDLLLSPLPKGYNRKQLQSPRKITDKLYVHTMDKKMDPKESPHSITYSWGSPTKAQDIEKINSITSKRNLRDSDPYELNIKVPRLKKLNKFISDRQENIKEK